MRYMSEVPRGAAYPFWVRVRDKLAMRGKTWSWLASETRVARSTMNKWKTQPRPPLPSSVIPVAKALGIPSAEALTLAGILPGLDEDESRIAGNLQRAAENWAERERDDEEDA